MSLKINFKVFSNTELQYEHAIDLIDNNCELQTNQYKQDSKGCVNFIKEIFDEFRKEPDFFDYVDFDKFTNKDLVISSKVITFNTGLKESVLCFENKSLRKTDINVIINSNFTIQDIAFQRFYGTYDIRINSDSYKDKSLTLCAYAYLIEEALNGRNDKKLDEFIETYGLNTFIKIFHNAKKHNFDFSKFKPLEITKSIIDRGR